MNTCQRAASRLEWPELRVQFSKPKRTIMRQLLMAAVMCVATTSYAGVPASITIVRHIAPPDLKPSEEDIKKKSC